MFTSNLYYNLFILLALIADEGDLEYYKEIVPIIRIDLFVSIKITSFYFVNLN